MKLTPEITKEITNLAKSMQVTYSDVLSLARAVSGQMAADGITGKEDLNEQDKTDLTEAYLVSTLKAEENMRSQILTKPETREAFILDVYRELKYA